MKKIISFFTIMAMLFTLTPLSVFSQENTKAAMDSIPVVKDETVYAALKADGSVDTVSVVNHIQTPSPGVYADKGTYSDVRALSQALTPLTQNGQVIWELPASEEGFYYQGTLSNPQLPYAFSLSYTLDGKAVDPQALPGKSGKVSVTLKAVPNASAGEYFRSNMMGQIQVPLSLDRCSNISAPGAQSALVGRTTTLVYMVLPGDSKEFTFSFDARNFQMDSITMSCTAFHIKDLIGVDTEAIRSGVAQMSDGVDQLLSGTKQLKSGISQMSGGIVQSADGSAALQQGMEGLAGGVSGYASGVGQIAGNLNVFVESLASLDSSGQQLLGGYSELSQGVKALLDSFAPLISALPTEQQQAYNQQIALVKGQLDNYNAILAGYLNGVAAIYPNLTALSGYLSELTVQNPQLTGAATQLSQGMENLTKGLSLLKSASVALPDQIDQLIGGQQQFKDGVEESSRMLDDFLPAGSDQTPVSFVNGTETVKSVQFVVRTPELKLSESTAPAQTSEKTESFWQRLTNLFR